MDCVSYSIKYVLNKYICLKLKIYLFVIILVMPFILPVYYALNGAKKMQYILSQYRVKYLKNILYSRFAVYGGVFTSNWFLFS